MQVDGRTAKNEGISLWLLARVYEPASSPEVALDYADPATAQRRKGKKGKRENAVSS